MGNIAERIESVILSLVTDRGKNPVLPAHALVVWCDLSTSVRRLEEEREHLQVLADGCPEHPAYRAIKPPRQTYAKFLGRQLHCKCVRMWEARQNLEGK